MNKKGIITLILVGVILVFLYLSSSTDLLFKEKKTEIFEVSVLVDAVNNKGWENFQMGMEQAGVNYNMELSFITLYDDDDSMQQKELLKREIASGTNGVILSTGSDGRLEEMIEYVPSSMAVVVYGSEIESQRVKGIISPDWLKIVEDLVFEVINFRERQEIVIVTVGENEKNITEIVQNFMLEFEEFNIDATLVNLSSHEEVEAFVDTLIYKGDYIVIAPEIQTLEEIVEAVGERVGIIDIYGMGWNRKIWKALENERLKATVAINSYDGGYLSVQSLAHYFIDGIDKSDKIQNINHSIITEENIFSEENQHILFPIS